MRGINGILIFIMTVSEMIEALASVGVKMLQGEIFLFKAGERNTWPSSEVEAAQFQQPDSDEEDRWVRDKSKLDVMSDSDSLQEFKNEFYNRLMVARERSLNGCKVASRQATATYIVSFKKGWEDECYIVWENGNIVAVSSSFEEDIVFVN